jgi:alkanesulfonate monooxygenase SsuD/methylene tetrahydromethanopterin reductase-like flavin-dependent oxidoreductase (luciferase family)
VQRPCPPIMIGGGSKRVLGIAGREADIVSLNFDNSSGRIGPEGVGSGTAEGTQQKIDWIRAGAGERFADIELEIGAYFTVVTAKREATLAGMSSAMGLTPEQLADHPHALIGSVDAICEALVARREKYGISYVTVGRAAMESFAPVVAQLGGS